MANMSYCRFENTANDLKDINDNELHEYVMNQVINKFIQK